MAVQNWSQIFHTIKIAQIFHTIKIAKVRSKLKNQSLQANHQFCFNITKLMIPWHWFNYYLLLTFAIFIVWKIWEHFWRAIFCVEYFSFITFEQGFFFEVHNLSFFFGSKTSKKNLLSQLNNISRKLQNFYIHYKETLFFETCWRSFTVIFFVRKWLNKKLWLFQKKWFLFWCDS